MSETTGDPPAWRRRLIGWLQRHWPTLAVLLVIAGYGWIAARYFTPALREPDTAGYFWMADRMAEGRLPVTAEDDLYRYQSHVWVETPTGQIAVKYAPGYPLALSLGMRLAGEDGAFAVNPLAGALALLGAYLLFGLWMARPAALLATIAIAINPVYLGYTNYPLTHALDVALVTWGMFFLWHWRAKAGWGSPIGAGLCLGAAATVRATSALFVLVVVLAAISAGWQHRQRLWRWLGTLAVLLVAYALGPLANAWYNLQLFGSPWLTGYALSNEQWAFSPLKLIDNAGWTLLGAAQVVGVLLFGLGLLGILRAPSYWDRAMRLAWFLPLWLLYASYYWAYSRFGLAFSRFYLALIPLFVGSAFEVIEHLEANRWRRYGVMGALLGLILLGSASDAANTMRRMIASENLQVQATASRLAAEHLPEGATVFADGPANYRLGRGKQFVFYDLDAFNWHRGRWQLQRQDHTAPRQQPARKERVAALYGDTGRQEVEAALGEKVRDALAEERTVAFIVRAEQANQYGRRLGDGVQLEEVVTWTQTYQPSEWQPDGKPRTYTWGIYLVRQR